MSPLHRLDSVTEFRYSGEESAQADKLRKFTESKKERFPGKKKKWKTLCSSTEFGSDLG